MMPDVSQTQNEENRVLDGAPDVLSTISETLWTDDTNAYFVRVNRGGVITWADMNGATSNAPGSGARPVGATTPV
jgi:hypothetical protein